MKRSVPWRVGALVLLSAAVLLAVLVATGPLQAFGGTPLAVDFAYAGPIKPGAAVRLSGQVVGAVREVDLLAGQDKEAGEDVMVRLHVSVEERAMPAVTDRASFYVTTLGVLGEHYVDIVPAPGGERLAPGTHVRGVDLARSDLLLPRAAALLEIMSALLDEGREDALGLVQKATRLVEQLDKLLAAGEDAPLLTEARALMTDTRELVAGLRVVVADGRQARELLRRSNRLAGTLDGADLGGALTEGRETMGTVTGTLGRLEQLPALSPERQEQLIRQLDTFLRSLTQVSQRADKLLARIEAGEGGAGRAFADEELVEDLKAVLKELRTNPFQLLLPEQAPDR